MTNAPSRPPRFIENIIASSLRSRVGAFVASWLIARWLTKSTRAKLLRNPAHIGLDWEPLSFRSEDGINLAGWLVSPPRPRATLVLFHGIHQSREHLLSRLAFLVPAGFRCLAVDHRAHGESEGRMSSFGFHERRDVETVLNHAALHWPNQPLACLGVSMGAAALCYAAASVQRCARAVILECLYHDILTAFNNRLEAGHYPDYFKTLAETVIRACERRLAVTAADLIPAQRIPELAPTPLLFVTGMQDRHATPAEAERLHARRAGPAELLLLPEAGHEDTCEKGGDLYRDTLLGFLERQLFAKHSLAA